MAKITKIALVAVAAGSLSVLYAAPAQAAPEGARCRFTSVTDPVGEDDVQTGQMNGGPITDPTAPGAEITLTCTIQVGPLGATHAGADAAAASSTGTGVAVLAPTAISYTAPEGLDVYQCTQVTVNGTTYYWNGTTWTTDPSSACQLATSQEIPPEPILSTINMILEQVDPTICPVIAQAFPPEGDIGNVYDCPPYNA